MRDETSASLASRSPPAAVRLAKIAVICLRLQKIDQPREHGPHFVQRADHEQIGDRVHDHDAGLEAGDVFVGHQQHFFDPAVGRTRRMELQQPLADPRLEVDADRAHVADDLPGRFLEREIQAALAAAAGRIHEMRRHAGLAGAGRAGHQDAAPAIEALAAHHAVQPVDAGRDAFGGRRMVQAQRGDRQDGDAVLIDEERILVRAVRRSPVLDDAQAPGRDLLPDAMVQHDHAVRDELLDAVPGQLVRAGRARR